MLTLLNLSIILVLLIMVAIWATYGFFSAFIQLILVIGSGVLALALWEPVSYMLLGRMPAYAHGVGLLAPFAILLIVLRTVFDKFCKANVHMPRIADQIGGAFCGLLAGILAFGMVLNGANFMPLRSDIMGWEPYKVQGNKVTENGEGRLTVQQHGERAIVTVTDTGVGMAPEAVDTVFEPYRQASTDTAAQFGGTGLGLSIAKHLADLMNGELSVRSALGEGSTFRLELPAKA